MEVRSTPTRTRKIPRGIGLDKDSVKRHLKAIEISTLRPTQYARATGLSIGLLVGAFQKHFPERWQNYLAAHSPLPKKICEYCGAEFVPANAKQRYCITRCGHTANTDRKYFGGNRRNTVGLADGICQLCGRNDAKGLSSHHVLGKENDPLNQDLVALCRGCHKIISLLGGRTFVDDPRAWEALIALAWMRRHGADARGSAASKTLYTEVLIELWDEELSGDQDSTNVVEEVGENTDA